MRLTDLLPTSGEPDPDALYEAFVRWTSDDGLTLYPHQDEALVEILTGANAVITTPTGSGKTLIATGAHVAAYASGVRSYYTAPIKALVSEKFFGLCDIFGAANVGMVTGDAAVNPDAPIVCCTAEILANIALRQGRTAEVGQVVMDEFHFIADRDRGWAWQVALTELPQAQFIIMSATLGDVTDLARGLAERTGRPSSIISDAVRPVPLTYEWSLRPLLEAVEVMLRDDRGPVYIVHSTQAAAVERAQSLLSGGFADRSHRRELVEAMQGFRFANGFGKTLSKLLLSGIAVHHAGMLPRYRRLVETLAQRGLLSVICGTDTLGVGINVPIRTVLFASLSKFDGRRQRLLRAREFHQIAGRAGRPGFDTVGYVVAQAPDHVIENAVAVAKAGNDPKKLRRVKRKKPPEGFVSFTEDTFTRLIAAPPEQLVARMRISHGMLLNLLQRDEDTVVAVQRLVDAATTDRAARLRLYRRALALGRSLLVGGVVVRLPEPTPGGRRYQLAVDLQQDFALNQPLSAFAIAALALLDPEAPDHALDVLSVIEATLENPMAVLVQQQFRARGDLVAELKADGVEYEERQEILDGVTWPRPLAELLEHAFGTFVGSHPWLAETPVSPKSIVRDMYERAMTFGEYVAYYKVQRSEGLLLRYLSDAYRALRQTVPESLRTEALTDIIEWLGEVTRLTDSSLLDEWERLTGATDTGLLTDAAPPQRTVTSNPRAFRVLVRNAMFRRVELASRDDVQGLLALDAEDPDRATAFRDWDAALGEYWDVYDEIRTDADARGPALLVIEEKGRRWQVRQIIADPEDNHDWSITATVDLDACDAAEDLIVHVTGFGD
ncbi:DEAD/DEAH box helicase [Propionicicella superfundia]|uniref:DEAD/DEAH box helicase n=1 Tax=Propionicicella superfundia TaxID=348582 RepID=UPI000491C470|nr:DEAD/DEAH box helicase [Propionicicella superfundia]